MLATRRRDIAAIAYGFMASKALFAALEIGLFSLLADGPRTSAALAAETGVAPNRLGTLLRALTALGLLIADDEGFRNAPAAQRHLVRGARADIGEYYRLQVGRQIYPALTHLDAGIAGHGVAFAGFDELMGSADEAATFTVGQHCASLELARKLVDQLPLAQARTLLDVGAGSGAFAIAFCERHPALRATLLDFPQTLDVARSYRDAAGLTDRIALIPGNATSTDWPGGQDVVLMSYLLSALTADEADAALAAAHHSLRPGGLLVVHDFMLDDDEPGPDRVGAVVPAVPGLAAGRVVVHRRRAGRPDGEGGLPPDARGAGRPRDHEARARPERRRPMNVAVGVTPMETRREVVLRLADVAEDLGYSAFTVAEGWGYDAGVLLAEIATRTSRIELGTGVLNVWGRSPASIAMLASGLHAVSGGRFTLGLGAGSPQLAEGLHDVEFRAPVRRLGATARQVRALLDGERAVTSTGAPRAAAGRPRAGAAAPGRARPGRRAAGGRGRRRLGAVPAAAVRAEGTDLPAGGRGRAGRTPAAAGRAGHPRGAVAGGGRVVGGVLPDQHGPAVRDVAARAGVRARRWTRWSRPTGAACRRPSRPPRGCWWTSCCVTRRERPGPLVRRGRRPARAGAPARPAAGRAGVRPSPRSDRDQPPRTSVSQAAVRPAIVATVRSSSAMRDRAATVSASSSAHASTRAQLGGRRRGLGGEHDEQHADRLLAVAQRRRYALPRRARLGERRRRGVEPLRAGGVASRRDGRGGVGRRQPFGEPPRHPGRRAEAQRAVLEQVDPGAFGGQRPRDRSDGRPQRRGQVEREAPLRGGVDGDAACRSRVERAARRVEDRVGGAHRRPGRLRPRPGRAQVAAQLGGPVAAVPAGRAHRREQARLLRGEQARAAEAQRAARLAHREPPLGGRSRHLSSPRFRRIRPTTF